MKIMGELYKEQWKAFKMPLQKNIFSGKFITFEGIDGVGKTSLLNLSAEFLNSNNINVVKTITPTIEIRNLSYWKEYANAETDRTNFDAFGLDMIAFADRLVWQNRFLEPTLSKEIWVLCDRHILNCMVYNQHDIFLQLLKYVIKPDLGIVVNAKLEVVSERIKKRGEREHPECTSEKEKMAKRYLEMAKKNDYLLIDTTKETPEENFEEIAKYLSGLIKQTKE